MTKPLKEVLEAAIAADFDDCGTHAAYADLLLEQGNPHGELIAVQLALEEPGRSPEERRSLAERERALLAAHGREWLGEFHKDYLAAARTETPTPLSLQFCRGWVDAMQIHHAQFRVMERLSRAPLARCLRRLEIDYGFEDPSDEWDDERQEMRPPLTIPDGTPQENEFYLPLREAPFLATLRYFRIGEIRGYSEPYWFFNTSGRADLLAPVLERTPRLEELHLLTMTRSRPRFDPTAIFRLSLPNLRVLRAYNLFHHATADLAANRSLRGLTQLLFHSHADDPCFDQRGPYLTLDDLRNVLHSPNLKSLTHLQFRLSSIGDEGCAEIVRSGSLKRLKYLDLRHGRITDAGVRVLAECADLRNLNWLELSRNNITEQGVALLRNTGVPFAADGQHTADDTHWLVEGDWE